jgi:hypothetical protein
MEVTHQIQRNNDRIDLKKSNAVEKQVTIIETPGYQSFEGLSNAFT